MIKFKIREKEYGIDMDSRCWSLGEPYTVKDSKTGKISEYISDATYHTTANGIRQRLLMLTTSREFDALKTFTELIQLFKDCAHEIDEQLKFVPPLVIKREL